MGANGSAEKATTDIESGRNYKTVYSIGDNIKVLEPKDPLKGIKLPEESHTPNRIYVTFYKDGHDVKAIAVYDNDCKKLYEIHTIDHKGLGTHYHIWKDGKPINTKRITPDIQALVDTVRNFNL